MPADPHLVRYENLLASLVNGRDGSQDAPSDRAIHRALVASKSAEPQEAIDTGALPSPTAANGSVWAVRALRALANSGGPEAQLTFGALLANQSAAGHFLQPSANDNLESWWYAELVLLHAVGRYAAETNSPAAYRAVEWAATYHLNETQPDHATNEPWAIFPFLLQPATRSLADQALHSANMMPPTGVSLLLLADALYCLRKFNHRGTA